MELSAVSFIHFEASILKFQSNIFDESVAEHFSWIGMDLNHVQCLP